MAVFRGLVLLFAARSTLVASLTLKTRGDPKRIKVNFTSKEEGRVNFPSPDWCDATITSNLGGLGPDTNESAELRYSGIEGVKTAEPGVTSIDLVVTALSSYKSQKPEMNGFNNHGSESSENSGCFGIINLDATD